MPEQEGPESGIDLQKRNLRGYVDLVQDTLQTLRQEDPKPTSLITDWQAKLRMAEKDERVAEKLVTDVESMIGAISDPQTGLIQQSAIRLYYRLEQPGFPPKSFNSVCNGMNIDEKRAQTYVAQGQQSLRQIITIM